MQSSLPSTPSFNPECVCILHAHEYSEDGVLDALHLLGVKIMTGMADFSNSLDIVTCLWIDARMTWRFPEYYIFSKMKLHRDLQVFIYNSEYLVPELQTLNHAQLRFLKGNIHLDLLC